MNINDLDEFYTILERGLESYKRPVDWQEKPKKLEGRKPCYIQDKGYHTGGTGDEH